MPDEKRESLTNVGALNTAIATAFRKRLNIDREINDLSAQHIAPLKQARTKLMRELKADTTIAHADLSAFYSLWRHQQNAKALLDADAGETVLDNMRTLFAALQVGEMLDFVDVLKDTDHQPAHLRQVDTARAAAAAEDEDETSPFLVP